MDSQGLRKLTSCGRFASGAEQRGLYFWYFEIFGFYFSFFTFLFSRFGLQQY